MRGEVEFKIRARAGGYDFALVATGCVPKVSKDGRQVWLIDLEKSGGIKIKCGAFAVKPKIILKIYSKLTPKQAGINRQMIAMRAAIDGNVIPI